MSESKALLQLGYEFSLMEEVAAEEWPAPNRYTEAVEKIEAAHRRMRATLEDIAAGRREFDLTKQGEQFDFVESLWFLVKLAEDCLGA